MIYIIEADCDPKIYKIGHSSNSPVVRLRNIQAYSPIPLKIVRTFPGNIHEEQKIHEELEDHRLHHEWFKDCLQIQEMIKYGWTIDLGSSFNGKRYFIPSEIQEQGWTIQKLLDWAIEQQTKVTVQVKPKKSKD